MMSKQEPTTVKELLQRIEKSWNTFYAYIDTLSEAQLTQPTDAAGWTAKDHLIHIAMWEDTLNAMLEKSPMWEHMGIEKAIWYGRDIDRINAIVQKRLQDMPLDEVRQTHREVHQRLISQIAALTDADLQNPVSDYQTDSTSSRPILRNFISDTCEAYEEHTPWIAAIVSKV